MKMRLQRIRCNNVFCFKDFDIGIESGCNRIIVKKDAGIGEIIRVILLGKPLERSEIQYLRPDDSTKAGYAELTMEIDSEKYTVRLEIDYAAKKSKYLVTSRKDNGVPRQMLRTPQKCRIEKRILDAIVLKKEDMEKLFEKGHERAEALICSAAGIDKLTLIKKKAQIICDNETRKHGRLLLEDNGLNRQNALLKKYRLVELNLERFRDELDASIAAIKKEQNNMIGRMGGLVRKVVESQLNELYLNNEGSGVGAEDLEDIIFALRYPLFFSQRISESVRDLQSALEDMKYPKNSVPAAVRDIATTGVCICGTEVDERMVDNISKAMERYSLQHPYFMINEVRSSIDSFSDGTLFNYYLGKGGKKSPARESAGVHQKPAKSKILETMILPEITVAAKTMKDLKKQIENLRSDLLYLTDMRYNNDPQSNLPACRQKIRSASISMEDADFAHEFELKTKTFTDMIDEIYHSTYNKVKGRILSQINSSLSSITKNSFSVEVIDGSLALEGKNNDCEMKCIAGLIFIDAVLKNMGLDLPIIVSAGFNDTEKVSMLEPLLQQMIVVNGQLEGEFVAI